MNSTGSLEGLVYLIAAGGGPESLEEARAIARRIEALLPEGARAARGELAGAVWGAVDGRPGPGDRLDRAESASGACVLRGDPVWLEPVSPASATAASVLERYEREGRRAFELLDNLYLAFVADRAAGEILFATDLVGGIRLYATRIGRCAVLATSYLLVSRLAEDKAPDFDAIAAFFHLGYFLGERTALRSVRVHPAGTVTRIRDGRVEVLERWEPRFAEAGSKPPERELEEAAAAFNASVREFTAGHESAWLALTAGLDSRCVLSSLIRGRIPYRTYTHGFPGCWEARRVERIVRRHGFPHRFVPLERPFVERLEELALASYRATEGEISAIEKSHLLYVLSTLAEECGGDKAALLLGGGAGHWKGTFYRLLRDERDYTMASVDRYVAWNLGKRLPAIFSPDVPALDPGFLRRCIVGHFMEVDGGTLYQKLDYFFLVRYRRWAGGVKGIYRKFFPVREPFVSRRAIDWSYAADPKLKKAKLPHFRILEENFPALQYDLTNKMSPALPLTLRTLPRFAPSLVWRAKQVLRGASRRYLPKELFPLADYVDYRAWIRAPSGRSLLEGVLRPGDLRSGFLYDLRAFETWLDSERREGFPSFPLLDKVATLELFFRDVTAP